MPAYARRLEDSSMSATPHELPVEDAFIALPTMNRAISHDVLRLPLSVNRGGLSLRRA
jgi:hypothetical protein